MAFIIDEERLIADNILKFDEKIDSPIIRFLDQKPTFVTYYHININESTTDAGFGNIDNIVGNNSPLKFQQINLFPIYGVEQIITQINDSDSGIDVSYESEAIILPNTIKPLPNDFFIIPYLKDDYVFRVTDIEFDNVRPDNFYKIRYRLEYNDHEKTQELKNQVFDTYQCIFENIGTENRCIIESSYKERLDKIEAMYTDMVSLYISLFYSQRYNVVLGENSQGLLYDPYMSIFINNNKLFIKKNDLDTIFLEEDHVFDNKKQLKYERSVWRFFERRDVNLIKPFYYTTFPGTNRKESGFSKWEDTSVYVVDIPSLINTEGSFSIFPDRVIDIIRYDKETDSKYMELIKKFIRHDEEMSLMDIDLNLNEELIMLDANLEMFFITPILLFIIRTIINEFCKKGLEYEKDVPKVEQSYL